MNRHWFEKLQVQIAAVGSLLVVYLLAWPMVRPDGPLTAVAFIPGGNVGAAIAFAIMLCVLAGACAALTVTSRPEGALLAAMLGAGGISMRSGQMRTLLWESAPNISGLLGELKLELLILAVAAALAATVAWAVHRILAKIHSSWQWTDPLEKLTQEQRDNPGKAPFDDRLIFWGNPVLMIIPALHKLISAGGRRGSRYAGKGQPKLLIVVRSFVCLVLTFVLAICVLLILLQSADRGQILFALVTSFFLAMLVSHQLFPTPYSAIAWGSALLVGITFYGFAQLTSASSASIDWTSLPLYARALPVDWLTFGGGGALLGFWVSARIHEIRFTEHLDSKNEKKSA